MRISEDLKDVGFVFIYLEEFLRAASPDQVHVLAETLYQWQNQVACHPGVSYRDLL